MNSTALAPKMVLPAMCTVALDGMKCMSLLLMPSVSRAWSPEYSMASTLPIWMPRYLTLAPCSITSPARGADTVTVSIGAKAAVYER